MMINIHGEQVFCWVIEHTKADDRTYRDLFVIEAANQPPAEEISYPDCYRLISGAFDDCDDAHEFAQEKRGPF